MYSNYCSISYSFLLLDIAFLDILRRQKYPFKLETKSHHRNVRGGARRWKEDSRKRDLSNGGN